MDSTKKLSTWAMLSFYRILLMHELAMSKIHAIYSTPSTIDQRSWSFIENLSDPLLLINSNGAILAFNKMLHEWLTPFNIQLDVDNRIADSFPELQAVIKYPESGEQISFTTKVKTTDIETHISCSAQYNCFIISFHPNNEQSMLQAVLDSIPARVFWKSTDGKYLGSNHLFAKDCGIKDYHELIGKSDFDVFNHKEATNFVTDDKEVMRNGIPKLNIEEPQTRPDGEISWLQTNKVPLRNRAGKVIGIMGSYTDITERKKYQQMIEHQARFDHLTGLPNRLALQERLQDLNMLLEAKSSDNKLEVSDADKHYGGLLFIDLDYFKTVNDSLGHKVGDSLLQEVANRITLCSEGKGFVARLGGDEFSVLMTDYSSDDTLNRQKLTLLANTIRDAVLKAYHIGPHNIHIGISIGISVFSTNNPNWENKFNESDMAMYEAKASGRNAIYFFNDEMRKKINYRHQLQSHLSFACENQELFLAIQPQFNQHGIRIGGEGLLRWSNKQLGIVPPNEFIPISEQSGIIHQIGMWVFEHAFELVHNWSKLYGSQALTPLAVNVSAKQFEKSNFIQQVENLLLKYPLDASLIQFELTESLLLENQSHALQKLHTLCDMGFSLAIDDFGTGYSCLSYISELPIHKLKIDRSFTSKMMEDKRQATIVETIISMANNLGIGVIAEGVETEEQLTQLINKGCIEFQGYYFSKPVSEYEYISDTNANFNR